MKHVLYITLATIFFGNLHSSANSKYHKGCYLYFSHEVQGDKLSITSYYTGEYCDGASAFTQVFFGNGAQATWTTTTEQFSTSYTYPAFGHYTVQVFLNGYYDSEFDVVIGQDTAGTSGEIAACDSSMGCSTSFDYELSYSQASEEYFLTCTRTDVCHEKKFSWLIGPSSVSVNPVTIPFGKIAEGSEVNVCLKLQYTFCDTLICRNILFNQENATIIDELLDSTLTISIFPNPAYNDLQVKTINLKKNAVLTVYSFDGRKTLDYELGSSAKSEFTIGIKDLPPGMYFVKIVADNAYSREQKFVKE